MPEAVAVREGLTLESFRLGRPIDVRRLVPHHPL